MKNIERLQSAFIFLTFKCLFFILNSFCFPLTASNLTLSNRPHRFTPQGPLVLVLQMESLLSTWGLEVEVVVVVVGICHLMLPGLSPSLQNTQTPSRNQGRMSVNYSLGNLIRYNLQLTNSLGHQTNRDGKYFSIY